MGVLQHELKRRINIFVVVMVNKVGLLVYIVKNRMGHLDCNNSLVCEKLVG